MGGRLGVSVGIALCAAAAAAAHAQTWNDSATTSLIARAAARRASAEADTGLRDFEARAHGFVFFLGALGEGLAEPPKLIKADQLALEVYWKAPDRSKQRIIGWRDRRDLPTDIQYHRDHLGIVTNGFGNRIRLGEGDEVRDVPHPLAPGAAQWYDYALADSLTIEIPQRVVRVYEVLVRPKEPAAPRFVGTLYLDADEVQLVRMRFQFTRSAYLDPSLEDITIVLENGLWEGKYWLPRRQEIEIRRHTTWLDLPARGIIRGRWEIGAYRFNVGIADQVFTGPEIAVAPAAARSAYPWPEPLDAAIAGTAGQGTLDLASVRAAVRDLASARVLSGLPAAQPGAASVSDFLHMNRVEGLTPGAGGVVRAAGGAIGLRGWASYGLSDERFKGRAALQHPAPWGGVALEAGREVRDVGDDPLIAPLFNSFAAQELGRDYGDYVLEDRARLAVRGRLGGVRVSLSGGVERTQSLATVARPVTGAFRPNPPLGAGRYWVGRTRVARRPWVLPPQPDVGFELSAEAGIGDTSRYLRVRGVGRMEVPVGGTALRLDAWAGWGSRDLRPDRAFVWGGRGAEGCDRSRRCGGRYGAAGGVEWRLRVPFLEIPLGAFVSTGGQVVVAPFVRGAWLDGTVNGTQWDASDGLRPVMGLGVEWLHQLIRFEVAVDPRRSKWALLADLHRALWSLL
ncbi:MAG TPA: hypothetical protein VJL31_07730 [Gemmatimonadales bacterium]|nr:hypothetical protein [Gemmatimonadales bacterium]